MRALLVRFLGCVGAFAVCALLFPGSCTLAGALWGGAVLTVLYVAVRPILRAIFLPLDLLLFGAFIPLTDAWLVLWACAWTPGTALGYWQAAACALLCALFWLPYGRWLRSRG